MKHPSTRLDLSRRGFLRTAAALPFAVASGFSGTVEAELKPIPRAGCVYPPADDGPDGCDAAVMRLVHG